MTDTHADSGRPADCDELNRCAFLGHTASLGGAVAELTGATLQVPGPQAGA